MASWASVGRLRPTLYVQVLVAIGLGALLGHFLPETGEAMKPLGDGFVKLIKMLIAPIVFCTIVCGIAGMQSMKKVGKTASLSLLYFEVVTGVALLAGLAVVNLVQPGAGMHIDPVTLDATSVQSYATATRPATAAEFLLNIIPSSAVDAFAKNDILQVLLFSVLFGVALHAAGERSRVVFDFIEKLSHVFFNIIAMVMKVAPLGAFGAVAFTIGKHGVGTLAALGQLLLCFYVTCLLFIFGVLGLIARLHGFSLWALLKYLRDEILIVLGTSSSESVLPQMLRKLEALGVEKSVVGLVIPTGYSFNQDGTSIYLTMAAVFLAQAIDMPFDLGQQLLLLGVLLLTSKGVAGVTGTGFVVLAASVTAADFVPVGALALILGIDRFMSEGRSLTNLIGNGVATIVVGRWCGAVDMGMLRETLQQPRVSLDERRA